VKPILDRSCIACHTHKADKPAGNLVLDDEERRSTDFPYRGHVGPVSGTYIRLVLDHQAKHGHKPLISSWRGQPSRYVRTFQSRRSLLIWKVHGRRTDGWCNEDFPTETTPGDAKTLHWKGKPFPDTPENRMRADLDYTGSIMPPPDAVKSGKVKPLSDEDRRTLVRWIDLGCPIDLDYDARDPEKRGHGWRGDDNRPTLTLTYPVVGANPALTRILVGMHDYGTGLDAASFSVKADFAIDGAKPGEELSPRFKEKSEGVRELRLATPIRDLKRGTLTIAVKDRQGNITRIERTFSVGTVK
jgi:hypothetical protein